MNMQVQQRKGKGSDTNLPMGPVTKIGDAAVDKVESRFLLLWDELPSWQQNNEFIRGSYRQASHSFQKSLRSLGYLHNESVNIYSHLIGSILFVILGWVFWNAVKDRYPSASWLDALTLSTFFGSAILCLGLSTTYHTMSDHSKTVNDLVGKLDLLGIVCLISGSFLSGLYYGWYCEPRLQIAYCAMVSLNHKLLTCVLDCANHT